MNKRLQYFALVVAIMALLYGCKTTESLQWNDGSRWASGQLALWTYRDDALADTGEINLPNATSGFLLVYMQEEGLTATVSADGTVVLVGASTNTSTTNGNDTTLNVYDAGTYSVVENQLGSARITKIIYYYN